MRHLSEWHTFDPRDPQTYPKVDAPVQVRCESGGGNIGFSRDFFPATGLLSDSLITGWRYIKSGALRRD
jgi:hypothetical protein